MSTVLLEIGTEEIPASYMPPALTQLAELASARLQLERIAFDDVFTWGTPRRIALYVTGVAPHQAPVVREVRGPSTQAAFAANGEPTQAAIGFARSQGVAVSDLRIKKVDNTEYVFAVFHDEGRPTIELLPTIFPQSIECLTFPRTMRWGAGTMRFARPIRWIVALMDDQIVPFTLGEVTAGRITRGHRFLATGEVAISSAEDYRRIMEENQVLVIPDVRRELIRGQLETIAEQEGATILDDGSLLDETTFHLEYPTAVRCAFDTLFLSLPREVLIQVLSDEQHFFPLADQNGKLIPAFLAVRNGDRAYLGAVRDGYEAVARAKLIDALFFYEQDCQRPLADRLEVLREVIFQERLGTMHEKVERNQALTGILAKMLDFTPEDIALSERAALLSKADLVTAMVIEYPDLRGTMGRVYARIAEEPKPVAVAIGEHYQPRFAGDPIPSTPIGRAVALADKLDMVAASFAVGLIPTGSEDPYALRRAAQGVVRILAEANYRLSLPDLISRALALLTVQPMQPVEETQAALESFFRQRVENLLETRGISFPVIRTVMAVSADVPADALRRAQLIQQQLELPQFTAVIRAATRLANIIKSYPGGEIRTELLVEPAERELYARYREVAPRIEFSAERGQFEAVLELLITLTPAVDRFFEEILVMAEDPDVRNNRMALIWHVCNLYFRIADFSQLGM